MKKSLLYFLLACSIVPNICFGQFIFKDVIFGVTGLTNEGKIAGYVSQGGPYSIWLPDSGNVIIDIGGIAPGLGVGGQARFSTDGNFLCGTSMGSVSAEMSKYDRSTNLWTPVGSLGFQVDNSVSGGYGISGDGNTIAGNSWADTTGNHAYTHAVAYNPTEGLLDMGSIYDSIYRSTRANAVNYDGSVIVGWQDYNGPWKSAVWRKNPSGGYFPNEYILLDTTANPYDEYNQMGECSAVSSDGSWIGGYGDYANNNQPWIWSRDSGVINLGTFPNAGNGFVSDMTADGSIVVGWFDGQFFGDPQTPFIWTHSGGLQELNSYIRNVLGDSTYTHQVYTADRISPDGNYIAGYGVDTSTFTYFVYRVSLNSTTSVSEIKHPQFFKVFPNPTNNIVTIENSAPATLIICSMDGKVVYKTQINGNKVIDFSTYDSGIYSLTLQSGDLVQTNKIIKNE